jgi:branched-chain amino acid transport system permease protein
MRATAEEHRLAQSAGIRVKQIFSQVWMISGVVCVVAGILLALFLDVSITLGDIGIIALAVALVGGLDSIPGALIGGLIIGILQNLGGGYIDPIVGGGFADLTAYIMLLLILLVKPYGLFGEVRIERI